MAKKPAPKTALRRLLDKLGMSQAEFAKKAGLSKGAASMLINGYWRPVRKEAETLTRVRFALDGATPAQIARALAAPTPQNKTPGAANAEGLSVAADLVKGQRLPLPPQLQEDAEMLLAKQTLTQTTRQHFKLFRDPFADDVEEAKDVFLTPDIRYVREAMWATVRHGGMLGVVGESGSGKSTLRRDLVDRIQREQAAVVLIEPYVIAMEETDTKGKTLKSAHIAEAIVHAINPLTSLKSSPEARFAQLHQLLKNSHRAGNRHVLVIEEAHCLPTATLKHLKRFLELEDGFKKLLSIILVGQPELRKKLSESNPEVREVVQRCEVVELPALDNHLQAYLDFKLKRVGVESAQVFDKGAVDALRAKLSFAAPSGKGRAFGQATQNSLLYPLAVANVVSAAMNLAVSIGAPMVTADLVKEV